MKLVEITASDENQFTMGVLSEMKLTACNELVFKTFVWLMMNSQVTVTEL